MDVELLSIFDSWWTTGNVRADLPEEYHGPLFNEVLECLDERKIKQYIRKNVIDLITYIDSSWLGPRSLS